MTLFTRKLSTLSAPAVMSAMLAVVALTTALLPAATASAGDDLVLYRPGSDQSQQTGGIVSSQATIALKYTLANKNVIELKPWDVQYIKYGYEGLDEDWGRGFTNLTSGNYKAAAEAFARFLKAGAQSGVKCGRTERSYLVWATYYYAARASLLAGRANDEIGELALSDIRDEFPLQISSTLSARRDQEMDARALDRVKRLIRVKIDAVLSETGGIDRGLQRELLSAVDGARKPSEVAEAVRANFTPFYKQFSAPMYEQAVEFVQKPFKDPGREENYSALRPFWMFDMRLTAAAAYMGLGKFGEAMSELKADADSIQGEGGAIPIPSRDNREDPALLYVAADLANQRATAGFWHIVLRAMNLQARIYQTAGDFRNARSIYKKIADDLPRDAEFDKARNEATLNYAKNLARGVGGSLSRAESQLRGLCADFTKVSPNGYVDTYLMDSAQAGLYAGAYLALGEITYNEWKTTRRDTKNRQTALECYLVVTSMLSSDREKRAEALYWASRIYREIAEEEWASEWAGKPDKQVDPNSGRESYNPYNYYIKMADTLRDELKKNYSSSQFARMQ
ncbi:MAG: hypothetical protein AB7K09_16240 [Planctomycetota bacterium]